jgi:hypothetical protein
METPKNFTGNKKGQEELEALLPFLHLCAFDETYSVGFRILVVERLA